MRTGTLVVGALGFLCVGGIVGVQLWLHRSGGGAARDKAAAERQLVEVAAVLRRYWGANHSFPARLEDLVDKQDPLTREPWLVKAMIENPWKQPIEFADRSDDRVILKSKGPGVDLRMSVLKDQGSTLEPSKK